MHRAVHPAKINDQTWYCILQLAYLSSHINIMNKLSFNAKLLLETDLCLWQRKGGLADIEHIGGSFLLLCCRYLVQVKTPDAESESLTLLSQVLTHGEHNCHLSISLQTCPPLFSSLWWYRFQFVHLCLK